MRRDGLGVDIKPLLAETTCYCDVDTEGAVVDYGGLNYVVMTGSDIGMTPPHSAYGQVFESEGTTLVPGVGRVFSVRGCGHGGQRAQAEPTLGADRWGWPVLDDCRYAAASTMLV